MAILESGYIHVAVSLGASSVNTSTQAHGNDFCCIFRNWSRLGLKMYTFLTLEFTLL